MDRTIVASLARRRTAHNGRTDDYTSVNARQIWGRKLSRPRGYIYGSWAIVVCAM